jgi:ATP-dependent DNA helicase RecG
MYLLYAITPAKTPVITYPKNIKISELEKKIINEIILNKDITYNEIANKINIGYDTVKEYIKKLKTKKVLKRIGGTRAGYWEVSINLK